MFEIFKKAVRNNLEPSDFKIGMIVKMEPGYYIKNPYYVLIKSVTKTGITTTIPGEHELELDKYKDRTTWDHQISRMTIIGTEVTHGHLLFSQKLISEGQLKLLINPGFQSAKRAEMI